MKMLSSLIGVAAVIAVVWFVFFHHTAPEESLPPYVLTDLTEAYSNQDYQFSMMLPGDFTERKINDQDTGGVALVFENKKNEGIQILITPFDEDLKVLTKERIQKDIPDMKITDPQLVEIGEAHTGLAFRSDNKEFDGASREVWFVFRSNLYQISTYERLDPLLKAVFQTWKFL